MDQKSRALIQESWALIQANGEEVAQAFYARLFELDPTLQDLFAATEMESQAVKFVAMLAEIVRLIEDPERWVAALRDSGRRHTGYGVIDRHYRTVGEALVWAIDQATPAGLNDDTRQAWAEAYTRMSSVMRAASSGAPQPT